MFAPINQQLDEIRRDASEIIPEDDLVRKLERGIARKQPLKIKQGFDPTRPDLHIGHAVSMRKLRTFQELGHEVIFVVGDYTARVGDPSGRSEARPKLSPAEIDANAKTYAAQVSSILDVSKVRVEYNSQWLAPLDLAGILGIDEDVRNGFSAIRVHFDIKADAKPDDIKALVAQSQKRSAVFDIITNPTNVFVTVN